MSKSISPPATTQHRIVPQASPNEGTLDRLVVGDVYTIAGAEPSPERTFFRLIHKNPKLNRAWVIQLPAPASRTPHIKGPKELALDELSKMLAAQQIVKININPSPISLMSDAEIRAKYSDKEGRCTMIDRRDNRYAIIEKLIGEHTTAEILEHRLATSWVNEQANATKRSRAKLYDDLHSYWAGNFAQNALLPDYWRSGARGKERKQSSKLGRPNIIAKANGGANKGYPLSDEDKEKLHFGWRYFLTAGRTRSQAYLETMSVFYTERWEVKNGTQIPILLHTDLRPTQAQFDRWGPGGDPRLTASRIQLGEIDWAKKYRGISGSAGDGIIAVGMQAVCDTTTNDAYLKSVTSRLKTVGSVNRLLITESKSNLIIGLHCGFDAPSARTFLLAVAHGASSKVDFCAHFGITIKEEDWPACAARNYFGDNGEYRNELSRQALKQFGSNVDNIPSGQPQYNGVAESKHHLLHARLDHTLDGTTRGKPRRRGKRHPAIDACANYNEYMRELIREVLYHNNEELVPHLLTAEMRRHQVVPTRIAIYRWLVEHGYVVDFVPNIADLRAHLYPLLPATLTGSGVYLLREDTGDRDERIPNARYMGDYLIESGLLEHARLNGNRRISVRCDPTDPRAAWIQSDQGLMELRNIHPDPILCNQATLADLIAIKDEDKVREIESRGNDEQTRILITTERQAMLRQAQAEKNREMESLPRPLNKADHYSEIATNRQNEIDWLANQSSKTNAGITQSSRPVNYTREKAASVLDPQSQIRDNAHSMEPNESIDENTVDPTLQALMKFIRGQSEQ